MADDGLGRIDVTGRWVGLYRYRTEEAGTYPIIAEIRQNGDKFTGEMYDQITNRSSLLEEYLELFRDDIRAEPRRQLAMTVKRFGEGNVVVNSSLPETSDISGKITGSLVEFTKTLSRLLRGRLHDQRRRTHGSTKGEAQSRVFWSIGSGDNVH